MRNDLMCDPTREKRTQTCSTNWSTSYTTAYSPAQELNRLCHSLPIQIIRPLALSRVIAGNWTGNGYQLQITGHQLKNTRNRNESHLLTQLSPTFSSHANTGAQVVTINISRSQKHQTQMTHAITDKTKLHRTDTPQFHTVCQIKRSSTVLHSNNQLSVTTHDHFP